MEAPRFSHQVFERYSPGPADHAAHGRGQLRRRLVLHFRHAWRSHHCRYSNVVWEAPSLHRTVAEQ